MKKVLEFKLSRGWYHAGTLQLCKRPTRRFLNVDDEFDMHVSTSPPSHDEYYVLKCGRGRLWQFADGQDQGGSPWLGDIDRWLTTNFGRKRGLKLYAWAMG